MAKPGALFLQAEVTIQPANERPLICVEAHVRRSMQTLAYKKTYPGVVFGQSTRGIAVYAGSMSRLLRVAGSAVQVGEIVAMEE